MVLLYPMYRSAARGSACLLPAKQNLAASDYVNSLGSAPEGLEPRAKLRYLDYHSRQPSEQCAALRLTAGARQGTGPRNSKLPRDLWSDFCNRAALPYLEWDALAQLESPLDVCRDALTTCRISYIRSTIRT